MPTLFVLGRILLVLILIISGGNKLVNLDGTAQQIATEVPIPEIFAGLAAQFEAATGMATPKTRDPFGDLRTRLVSTAAATLYVHDFWNIEGVARMQNIVAV